MRTLVLAVIVCALAPRRALAQVADDPDDPDEAVIRADARERDRARVENDTTFATSLDLRRRGATDESLGDALEEAPGVHVRRLGDGLSPQTLTLRGAPGAQVTVALDGVVLNDAASDGVDVSLVAPSLLERADVYRGSAPLRLGVSGLGGAVELITRRAPAQTEMALTAGAGSFGAARANALLAGRFRTLRALLSVGLRGSRGDFSFYDDRGTPLLPGVTSERQNNASGAVDVLGRVCVGAVVERAACLTTLATVRVREVPGVGGIQTLGPYSEQARWLVSGRVPFRVGPLSGATTATLIARNDHFANRGEVPLFLTQPFDSRSSTYLAELGAETTDTLSTTRLDTVLKLRAERFVPSEGDGVGQRLSLLTGLEASTPLGVTRLVGGLGLHLLSDARDASEVTRALLSPRFGLSWRPSPTLEIKANAGRYARPPALGELYGDRGVIAGNPGLRPESGYNADVGLVLTARNPRWRARFELAGYLRRVTDLISLVQTSRLTFTPVNLDRATVLGAEAVLRVSFARALEFTGSYTLTDATTDPLGAGGGERFRVPGVALHDLSAAMDGSVGLFRAGATVSYVSSAFLTAANVSEVPARWMLGASASMALPFARWLSVQVNATNLLDLRTAYVTQRLASGAQAEGIAPLQDFFGYPLPGRSFFVSLNARLSR